jgi:FAD/FMN-containing dehydrogenase
MDPRVRPGAWAPPAEQADSCQSKTSSQDLIETLKTSLGSDAVSTDDETRERLSFDAIDPSRLMAGAAATGRRVDAVVRAANTDAVSLVLRLASQAGVAIVPYGGGTGIMGAVIPGCGGIALDLRGMDEIIEIRAADRLAVVQPGVCLADLDAAAATHGLMLGHDP